MRERLRPAHTAEELTTIYAEPHDHMLYGRGHGERVDEMIRYGLSVPCDTAADLSCGNGAVIDSVKPRRAIKGDFADGYELSGPIEETITAIEPVDLFICGETFEHLDDPDKVIRQIREKADRLLFSTPVDNWCDKNVEHYWAWDVEGVKSMLSDAGFTAQVWSLVDSRLYGEEYCYMVGVAI